MPAAKVLLPTAPEPDGTVSRVWVQVTALVLLCGLAVLGFLGYRAYSADPPHRSRTARGGRERLRRGTHEVQTHLRSAVDTGLPSSDNSASACSKSFALRKFL